MRPRPPPLPRQTLPPEILPPDFVARHKLIERLILDPLRHRVPPRAWAPLSDEEWEEVAPYLWTLHCGLQGPGARRGGRPMAEQEVRARLDAIFRAVTLKHPKGGRGTWKQLPEEFGRSDTVSRTYRRWAQRGFWTRLLQEVADPTAPPALKRLAYFACCAFRRAYRILGRAEVAELARKLKMHTAMPAPSCSLPARGLSEIYGPVLRAIRETLIASKDWLPPRPTWRLMLSMTELIHGKRTLRRIWEPA